MFDPTKLCREIYIMSLNGDSMSYLFFILFLELYLSLVLALSVLQVFFTFYYYEGVCFLEQSIEKSVQKRLAFKMDFKGVNQGKQEKK